MTGFFQKWGIWGAVGFMIGLFLVQKSQPHSDGGIVLLLAIGLAVGLLLGGVWRLVRWVILREREKGDE